MSETDEAEIRLYNHTDQLLQGHQRLLSDGARNQAFYSALSSAVTNDSKVLDIGSGTGIWAVTAALLGARKVVAVEYEPLLIGVIKALAQENGVSDKIEVVLDDSRQVQLGREFDIVISETIGHLVFDESIVSIMIDARERFLKPDGIIIPQTLSLVAAAAHLENANEKMPAGISLKCSVFDALLIHIPLALRDKSSLRILSESQTLITTDLRTIGEMPDLNEMSANWELSETEGINCFAVWAEAVLSDEVSLTTKQSNSWMPLIYRIKPFQAQRGAVNFKLTLTNKSNYWTAAVSDRQHFEEQKYSPALAATELLMRSRNYSNALEHLTITHS